MEPKHKICKFHDSRETCPVCTFPQEKEEKKCECFDKKHEECKDEWCSCVHPPHDSSDWENNGYTKEENEIQGIITDFFYENEGLQLTDVTFIKRVLSTRIGTLIRNLIQKEREKRTVKICSQCPKSNKSGMEFGIGYERERVVEILEGMKQYCHPDNFAAFNLDCKDCVTKHQINIALSDAITKLKENK